MSKREVFIVVWAKAAREDDEYTETHGLRLVENEHVQGGILTGNVYPPSFFGTEEDAQAAIDRTVQAEELEVKFCGEEFDPELEWNFDPDFKGTDRFQIWEIEEAGL